MLCCAITGDPPWFVVGVGEGKCILKRVPENRESIGGFPLELKRPTTTVRSNYPRVLGGMRTMENEEHDENRHKMSSAASAFRPSKRCHNAPCDRTFRLCPLSTPFDVDAIAQEEISRKE